jgi:CheY-like chemotaxis protein
MVSCGTGKEAIDLLKEQTFDCVVVDLGLPDMSGSALIETARKELGLNDLPIIVYTGRDLTKKEAAELNKIADAVIVKDVSSIDKLLDETALFLHRVEANLPQDKRRRLENIHSSDSALAGKKVLIVDDDIRNIFALTSFLERHNMVVIYAENGKDAVDMLGKTTDVDAVLMDVMMPGMDGYETMRAIRKNKRFKSLPIIAVTAKAMRGDREKCIEAGASDYITKPVDVDQLLSLMRVWLFK